MDYVDEIEKLRKEVEGWRRVRVEHKSIGVVREVLGKA